jgi:serine/threonine protein kinase
MLSELQESTGTRPRYSAQSDIFSLGCVMFELCELRRPYNTRAKTSVPSMRGPSSRELKELISDMMSLNPSSRPTTETLYRRFKQIDARRKTADGDFVEVFEELAM